MGKPVLIVEGEFQSAPVVADGRCLINAQTRELTAVSIRARRCRRAMRDHGLGIVDFVRFQSAPVVADGRCVVIVLFLVATSRFNPRPSLPTGDACAMPWSSLVVMVSIRARRCRRAMPARLCKRAGPHKVSIRARRCRRAMLERQEGKHRGCVFQSAPVVADGRCRHRGAIRAGPSRFNPRPSLPTGDATEESPWTADWRVSIRARRCRRAMPARHAGG